MAYYRTNENWASFAPVAFTCGAHLQSALALCGSSGIVAAREFVHCDFLYGMGDSLDHCIGLADALARLTVNKNTRVVATEECETVWVGDMFAGYKYPLSETLPAASAADSDEVQWEIHATDNHLVVVFPSVPGDESPSVFYIEFELDSFAPPYLPALEYRAD